MLDHLEDIESDMSVFHRVEHMETLPGPRFFRLAVRLPAYGGVLTARVRSLTHPTPGFTGDQGEQEVPGAVMSALVDKREVTA